MKATDPLWKLLFPSNWKTLAAQAFHVMSNYRKYGNLSLDKNSPAYFNDAYARQTGEYVPEHYHRMLKYLPQEKPIRLCDFGCGTGQGLAFLAQKLPLAELTAIDYSTVAVEKTRQRVPQAQVHCLDITKDGLPGEYDYIVTIETLEHFKDPIAIVKLLLNHVREKLLISIPYTEKGEPGVVNLFAKHVYRFNTESFDCIPKSKVLEIAKHIGSENATCIFVEIAK